MKIQKKPTLADCICDLRARKIKKTFFTQINTLIDWNTISILINKDYSKGKSSTGKPSYDGLLLFKMYLLQS
ncbi:MAG: IS5 family transposase [Halieaceae bacterium]|jgi:IS5 family transposase